MNIKIIAFSRSKGFKVDEQIMIVDGKSDETKDKSEKEYQFLEFDEEYNKHKGEHIFRYVEKMCNNLSSSNVPTSNDTVLLVNYVKTFS